jgi:MYXO-CTERM domain-containing protein
MGADFWVVGHDYAAAFSAQSFPFARDAFNLYPGQEVAGFIEMRNTGSATWQPGQTNLGTTEPRDVASPLAGPGWLSAGRPASIDRAVAPGEVGRFNFTVRAPSAPGDYPQFFNLVQEGVTWFSQQGGPPDNQIQIRVTVVPSPECPGVGADWSCEGSDRVRCDVGTVVREACAHGCIAGMCAGAPVDMDSDGALAGADCNDSDPTVYPGATDGCDDGIDQDCDGYDSLCTPPVEGDAGTGEPGPDAGMGGGGGGGGSLSGSCSAAPGGSGGWLWTLAIGLAWVVRRRAR